MHCYASSLFTRGTYVRWELRNRYARTEQSLLFDLLKAYEIESGQNKIFSRRKIPIFFFMRAQHVLDYHLILVTCVYTALSQISELIFQGRKC